MARITGMILGLGLVIVISSLASPASAWDSDDDDDYKHKHKHRYHPHHHHAPPIFVPLGDDDDDDHEHRHHRHAAPIFVPPVIRQPLLIPPQYGERYDYQYDQNQYSNDPYNPYRIDYGAPRNQAVPEYQPAPQYQPLPEYQPGPQNQLTPEAPLPPAPIPPEDLFGENQTSQAPSGPILPAPEQELNVLPEFRPGQFVDQEVSLYPHVRVKGRDAIPRHAIPQIVAVRSPDPFRFPGLVYVQVAVPPRPVREAKVEDGGAKVEMKYEDFEVKIVSAKGVVSVEYDD